VKFAALVFFAELISCAIFETNYVAWLCIVVYPKMLL